MFCPKCSQQQNSDAGRFCPRCGFKLNVVKALLADEDVFLTSDSELRLSSRIVSKKDMTIGAVLMFFMAWRSVWATEDLSFEDKITGLFMNCVILSVSVNVIPVIRNLYRRMIIQNKLLSSQKLNGCTPSLRSNAGLSAIPAAYQYQAADYMTATGETSRLVAPPSVTKETTELLNRQLK